MGKRSKEKHAPGSDIGNRPFRDLDRLVRQRGIRLRPAEPPDPIEPVDLPEEETDEELFNRAMRDVDRAAWQRSSLPATEPAGRLSDNSELHDLRLMQAALNGDPPPSIIDHPEYIEGWGGVAGKLYLPKLRNGMYSVQGQVDLHGLNRFEARERLEEFIVSMSRFRACCVKIIHGRGINSPKDSSVLKDNLQRWLSTRRMARHVLAYASAPAKDGGVGAVYVLLRPPSRGRLKTRP